MKALLRSPVVQAVLGLALAAYLGLALKTMRWREQNREAAETVWDRGGGVIVCFWHGRIGFSPACWPMARVHAGAAQEPRALISLSPDGAFVAAAVARLGFPAIRGSSTKASDKAKFKGGAGAFREVLRWLKGGGGVAITPDGPRGPAGRMAEGPALLAKLSGAPVLLVGLAGAPALELNSWDRARLPRPFSQGAIVWAGPFQVSPLAGEAELEAARMQWEAALTQATEDAEAMLR